MNKEFSDELQLSVNRAFRLAGRSRHDFVTPEHLLLAFFEYDSIRLLFDYLSIPMIPFIHDIEEYLGAAMFYDSHGESPVESLDFRDILTDAVREAEEDDMQNTVDVRMALKAFFNRKESFAAYFLSSRGLSPRKIDLIFLQLELEDLDSPRFLQESQESDEESEFADGGGNDAQLLSRLTVDLTGEAAARRLAPFTGREDLLEKIELVLLRSRKRNPLLLGEPGVGKTALVEGLAQRIVRKKAAPVLHNRRILAVDVGSLVAGTKYRGEFEIRMKRLLAAAESDPSVILFLDEMHLVMGAGSGENSKIDVANMLKSGLARGRLTCIGTAVYEDFKKRIEPDKAFMRRFQMITVPEPSAAETETILKGIRAELESYHNVKIPVKTALSAVHLSQQFLKDRRQPDKSIDVLDQACAETAFRLPAEFDSKAEVSEETVEKVVAEMAGIPRETLTETDADKLRRLEQTLKESVFGQDAAIETVVDAVKRSLIGFRKENLPAASLLFIGPTGVGKTELARRLSQSLGIALIRFDMSEYQEKSAVARLIGAPPGYVGYQEGGILIDEVRKKPYAVLLLDEIEKAHPDIFNVLLQVMDYAVLTDTLGRKADFSRIILIMTGNIGASDWERGAIGFAQTSGEYGSTALKEIFSPEFRNRLDAVVRFARLGEEQVKMVVQKEIDEFSRQLKKKGIVLSVTNAAVGFLARKGFSRSLGARPAARAVETFLKSLFPDEILFGSLKNGGKAIVDSDGNRLYIKKSGKKFAMPGQKEKQSDKRRKSESSL